MPEFAVFPIVVSIPHIFLAIFCLTVLLGYLLLKIVPGLKRGDPWCTILANGSKPRTGASGETLWCLS